MMMSFKWTMALLVALLVGMLLGAALPRAESANTVGRGRYEMARFSAIGPSVLDTHTGTVWSYKVSTNGPWQRLSPGIPQ